MRLNLCGLLRRIGLSKTTNQMLCLANSNLESIAVCPDFQGRDDRKIVDVNLCLCETLFDDGCIKVGLLQYLTEAISVKRQYLM